MANKSILPPAVTRALHEQAPKVARHAFEALAVEIPAYAPEVRGEDEAVMAESAILVAVTGLLRLTERPPVDISTSLAAPTREAAYEYGRYEALSGRSPDALLAAYRVGARVAWRELSSEMVLRGVGAESIAIVAELVFAYIDQLSAASMIGFRDEVATVGRAREQQVEHLIRRLFESAPIDELTALAEAAEWPPPHTLTAVVLPSAQARPALQQLDHRTLIAPSDLAAGAPDGHAVLLVPDVDRDRDALLTALRGFAAIVGPARPWAGVAGSFRTALLASDHLPSPDEAPLDTDAHLAQLIIDADPITLADLRGRVLAPLDGVRPATADRLAETLRSWLLHQGRREEVAASLNVHPQTVRYRMGQLRELFGDQLTSPEGVLEIVVALATIHTEPDDAPGRVDRD